MPNLIPHIFAASIWTGVAAWVGIYCASSRALSGWDQILLLIAVSSIAAMLWSRTLGRTLAILAEKLDAASPSRHDLEFAAQRTQRELSEALARAQSEEDQRLSEREAYEEALANTVHELRTPLTTIVATLEMVQFGMLDDPVDREELVAQADAACHHMSFMVNDLLDAAAIAAGRLRLDVLDFDVQQVVEDARRILNPTAQARSIEIDIDSEGMVGRDNQPLQVRADRMRTLQVLFNLAGNAIKYSEDHTRVSLRVHAEPQSQLVRFEVIDQGVGVPAAKRSQLFGRFSRVHRQQDSHASGSGVGLNFSKSLVERMDGEIGYQARQDEPGSVFWFALPMAESPTRQPSPQA